MDRVGNVSFSVRRPRPALVKLLALSLGGVLVAVLLVELGARGVSGNWTDSVLERSLGLFQSSIR